MTRSAGVKVLDDPGVYSSMLAVNSRIPDSACALFAMAGSRDCPLVFDWACAVHAHVGWSVQSYIVVVLGILHTRPADVYPLSACR